MDNAAEPNDNQTQKKPGKLDRFEALVERRAVLIAVVLIAFAIVSPFIFRVEIPISWWPKMGAPNEIGDALNGMMAPFISLAAAVLLYKTIQEQVRANQAQRDAIEAQKAVMDQQWEAIEHQKKAIEHQKKANELSETQNRLQNYIQTLEKIEAELGELSEKRFDTAMLFQHILSTNINTTKDVKKESIVLEYKRYISTLTIYLFNFRFVIHSLNEETNFAVKQNYAVLYNITMIMSHIYVVYFYMFEDLACEHHTNMFQLIKGIFYRLNSNQDDNKYILSIDIHDGIKSNYVEIQSIMANSYINDCIILLASRLTKEDDIQKQFDELMKYK